MTRVCELAHTDALSLPDSTVELAQWRVLLNMLPTQSRGNVPCPRFDEMRHAGVCAEVCMSGSLLQSPY
jgi:hypothetical protein